MKVWLINQYAVPPTRSGGTRHFSLAKSLVRKGVDVEIIASSQTYLVEDEVSSDAVTRQTYDGVAFTFLRPGRLPVVGQKGGRIGAMLAFTRTLRSYLRTREDTPTVILGSAPTLFNAAVAHREARRRGVPFVLEVRDIWPQSLIDLGGYSERHPGVVLLGALEKHLYRRADHIVTLLPHAAQHIAARGGDPGSVTWIPNGIDLSLLPESPPPGSTGATTGDAFTVMYVGAHGVANALDAVLDAACLLQERNGSRFQLVMIGEGHEKQRLKQRAADEGIDTVDFRPSVPKQEVYQHLYGADALIVNMNAGGLYRFGISFNKLYDYLAAARPVVFGSAASNDPIAEAGAGICVPANDAAEMAAAIERLAEMPAEERAAMGQRGRSYVEEHNDLEKLGLRLMEVLQSVTAPG